MRRDYFSLEVTDTGSGGLPTAHVVFDGPSEGMAGRLTDASGDPLDADEIDVTYRLQDGETGVFGVTNRVTGDFILELNAENEVVLGFIRAAREHGTEDERYRIRVTTDDEPLLDHEKGTLLVYDAEGGLMRSDSLIPSGVEL